MTTTGLQPDAQSAQPISPTWTPAPIPLTPGKRSRPGGSCRGASAAVSAAGTGVSLRRPVRSGRSESPLQRGAGDETDGGQERDLHLLRLRLRRHRTARRRRAHRRDEAGVHPRRGVVQEPHRRAPLPRRPDRRQGGDGRRGGRSRGRVPARGGHAARLRPEQHHLRGAARGGRLCRTGRRRASTATHRSDTVPPKSPPSWAAKSPARWAK